jgi:alpha-L-fucosidase 2
LKQLDSIGPSQWVGYSYAWEGNLKARAHDGAGAAKALKIFAEAFCLPNSFHVNGDQSGKGYANARYRPFTLEGNFAFASGMLEMLIQSHAGYIEVMPAIPDEWKDVSFRKLRTEGAFLVDSEKQNGHLTKISVTAEKGGLMKLKLTHNKFDYAFKGIVGTPVLGEGILEADMQPGSTLEINLEY